MGGNTKILLELINNLHEYYNFVIFTSEPLTFKNNINKNAQYTLIEVAYNFTKFSYLTHLKEISYITSFYKSYFSKNSLKETDYFYSCSDFGPDVLPVFLLKNKFKFNWIASMYLFVPSPLDNLKNKYRFPFIRYIIYYFYQQFLFKVMLLKLDLCLVTNEYDKRYFPSRLQNRILSIYGGVNIDQIKAAIRSFSNTTLSKEYDAVFCSRLHPQKGISQLLDIWKIVVKSSPGAVLGIIGNGDSVFENYLKDKAQKLSIGKNIDWLGYVNNTEKYKIYLKSKMLVHTTIYDNNGMVAAEALCTGLPVIMYDLPSLGFYEKGCVKISQRNYKAYAEAVVKILTDVSYYNQVVPPKKSIADMRDFWNWKFRSTLFNNFIKSYEKHTI